MDAHPIHIHQVQFQVINREAFMGPNAGTIYPPEAWETGFKDTVIVYPDQLTRVKAQWTLPGLFVWHCHILEHEDNEMMRPYEVLAGTLQVCKQNSTGTPLSGWDFSVNGITQTTDGTGCTIFDLAPGPYTVTETLQPGWTNITPLAQDATVVSNAQTLLTFVNQEPAVVVNGTLQVCKENSTNVRLPGWDFTADGVTHDHRMVPDVRSRSARSLYCD
jgi:Putative multicopper oxidases